VSDFILRKPEDGDAAQRLKLGRHPDVLIGYGVVTPAPMPMSLEDAQQWVHNIKINPYAWIIEYKGSLAGVVRLDNVDHADKRASLAVGIENHNLLGKGIGTDVVREILKYAFNKMYLHRISVRVLERNIRARRCYEKNGFIFEGIEREAALVGGKRENDVMMAILAHEFAATQPLVSTPALSSPSKSH
jgi:RimJ/RimL family protein N-acetyltransferase